jgi:DNA-binding NarL/FixJ family response regulator
MSRELKRPVRYAEGLEFRFVYVVWSVNSSETATEKRIQAQLRGGKGMRKIARELGVGTGTVQRIKQEMKSPFVGAAV